MAEIASAYLTIIPSFKSGLGNTLQKAVTSGAKPEQTGKSIGSKISSGIGGALSTMKIAAGSFLGGAALGAVQAITGSIAGLASEAVTASDATDKFKSTLNFAGLGTEQIEALTASCQKYADQTVYDLSDIQGITAQLAANNVKDFDRLAEAAGNLNAVAGGNKDTFKSVGMVLTQTAGQGKLTTENFNQLADAIPGASGVIQQELANMGAYTGNFRDAMAKGEITAEEFNQAILNLGFQDAAVEAATSATTMEGAMGNLEASVVNLLKNGFDLIKPSLTAAIGAASEFISAVPGALQSAFEATSSALAPFIEQCQTVLGPAIQLLIDKFLEFCEAVAPVLLPIFQALGEVLSYVGGIIGEVFVFALNLIIQAVTAIFDQLTVFLDWMSTTFGPFWNDVLLPAIQIAWEAIQTIVSTAVTAVENIITVAISIIQAIWEPFWGIIGTVVETVWNTIQTVISTVMGVIQGIIQTVMGIISGDWSQAWEGIKQVGQSIWDGIKSLIQIALDFIKNIITNVLNAIKGLWDSIWNAIKGLVETVWNGIKSAVETAINAVKSTIDSVLNGIKSLWESAWNTIKDFVTTAWNGIKDGVSNGINAVVDFVSGLPGKILGALGDLGGLLFSAGKSIIDGFLNGLKAAWGAVTDFVSGIAGWIASHKGPLDYDRKLLVPAGKAIVGGLGSSMRSEFEGLKGEVRDYGSDLQKEIQSRLYPTGGIKFENGLSFKASNGPMTASEFYDVMNAVLNNGSSKDIVIALDGKELARVSANSFDAALATRGERVGRVV